MRIINQYKGLRKEVYILFIGRIVTRFGSMVWSMLTLILNQKLGYSAGQVSYFMFGFSMVSMLTSVVGGKLADKCNKKHCIIAFDCLSIFLYMICAVIELSTLTVILIVIAAAAQWAEHPAYNALIADITPSEDRERAYALQYLGTNIGLMAAPTLAGILFKNHLPLLFVICSVAIAVSTVLIGFKVRNIEAIVEADQTLQRRRDRDSLLKVLSDNRILIPFLISMGLYSAGYEQYNYLMPLDMGRIYGEDGALLYGTLSSTNCIIVVLFSSIILSLFCRVRPIHKVLISEGLLLTGFVLFVSLMEWIPGYYLAVIIFTFGEIFAMMGSSTFLTLHSPASHRGRIQGLDSISYNLFSSFFLLIIGKIYDTGGSVSSWLFVIGIMVLAIGCALLTAKMDTKICTSDKEDATCTN